MNENNKHENDTLVNEVLDALDIDIHAINDKSEIEQKRNYMRDLMYDVDQQIIAIKGQLDETKHLPRREWKQVDPIWWRKVNSALRYKGALRMQLQEKTAELTRLLKTKNIQITTTRDTTRERLFVKAAKAHLKADTFAKLWEMVDEMQGNKLE